MLSLSGISNENVRAALPLDIGTFQRYTLRRKVYRWKVPCDPYFD